MPDKPPKRPEFPSMTITVHLFAAARDQAGTDRADLPWQDGLTVNALRESLARQIPALATLLPRCLVAVNHEFADDGKLLQATDEVAIIPPVSGG